MSGLSLQTTDEVTADFNQRVASGEWWVIATFNRYEFLQQLEEAFYTPNTGANGDFHLLSTAGWPVICYAHKRRLSPETFTAWSKEHGVADELADGLSTGHDIVLAVTGAQEYAEMSSFLYALSEGLLP
jgi:hypothetical protein